MTGGRGRMDRTGQHTTPHEGEDTVKRKKTGDEDETREKMG